MILTPQLHDEQATEELEITEVLLASTFRAPLPKHSCLRCSHECQDCAYLRVMGVPFRYQPEPPHDTPCRTCGALTVRSQRHCLECLVLIPEQLSEKIVAGDVAVAAIDDYLRTTDRYSRLGVLKGWIRAYIVRWKNWRR